MTTLFWGNIFRLYKYDYHLQVNRPNRSRKVTRTFQYTHESPQSWPLLFRMMKFIHSASTVTYHSSQVCAHVSRRDLELLCYLEGSTRTLSTLSARCHWHLSSLVSRVSFPLSTFINEYRRIVKFGNTPQITTACMEILRSG